MDLNIPSQQSSLTGHDNKELYNFYKSYSATNSGTVKCEKPMI